LKNFVSRSHTLRLSGIDILRGVAIFAVAVLHSGNGEPANDSLARTLEHMSGFAVPFFLATSFYLATQTFYTRTKPYSLWTRLKRLLIPYAIWSLIYLLFAALKHGISREFGGVDQILQDPIGIFFFGGAAYHLYFIPILLVGTLLFKGIYSIRKRYFTVKLLFLFLLLSLILYEIILRSGNTFALGSNVAFQVLSNTLGLDIQQNSLLRVIGVAFAWMLRCLPYIAMALLLRHPSIQIKFSVQNVLSIFLICLGFFMINGWGDQVLPASLYELARGYTALIFAIALSAILPDSKQIQNLGLCSFGIYLMHLIWVEVFKSILGKLYPGLLADVTVLSLLTFSSLAWITSWMITAWLMHRKGLVPKILFGT
jgi:peptidoglycan/LPS O-acetylase OafA/YrhL